MAEKTYTQIRTENPVTTPMTGDEIVVVIQDGESRGAILSELPGGAGSQDLQSVLDQGGAALLTGAVTVTDDQTHVVSFGTTSIDAIGTLQGVANNVHLVALVDAFFNFGGGGTGIQMDGTIMRVSDNENSKGLEEDADYSANKTDLSYATKKMLPPKVIQVACSDETTPITAGTNKIKFRMPYAMTLTAVRASLTTAQATSGAGGIVTVDINESNTTILSTKLTIDNTELTSTTATTPAVISDSALADDAEIEIDIDVVGDGTATGLKVTLIGT